MNPRSFFGELKRRNVYKVAVAYAIVGWLLVRIATQVFPFFEIPNWAVRLIVLAIAIGFPIALVIAWAFELTPEGLKRTEDVDLTRSARQPAKRTWIFVVIIGGPVDRRLRRYSSLPDRRSSRVSRGQGPGVRAFEWLERARRQRDGGLIAVRRDPFLANLKGDRAGILSCTRWAWPMIN